MSGDARQAKACPTFVRHSHLVYQTLPTRVNVTAELTPPADCRSRLPPSCPVRISTIRVPSDPERFAPVSGGSPTPLSATVMVTVPPFAQCSETRISPARSPGKAYFRELVIS